MTYYGIRQSRSTFTYRIVSGDGFISLWFRRLDQQSQFFGTTNPIFHPWEVTPPESSLSCCLFSFPLPSKYMWPVVIAFCITAWLVSCSGNQTEPLVLSRDKQKIPRCLHVCLIPSSFYAYKWKERITAMSPCPHVSFRNHDSVQKWERTWYSHAPHNDVSVNDGTHIRGWSHNIIIPGYS